MGVMSIREFNQNVSKALALVEAGDDIVLTRRGKRIARITRERSIDDQKQLDEDLRFLRDMMHRGFDFGGAASYEERTER